MSAPRRSIGRFRVPGRSAVAQRHFVSTLYLPRSSRQQQLLRVAERLPPALGSALLARFSGPPAGEEPEPAALELERRVLRDLSGGAAEPAIALLGYAGQGRAVSWVFTPGETAPRWVSKIARAVPASGLERERSRLHELRASLSPELAGTLAAPVAFAAEGGWQVLVSTARPGRTLAASLARAPRDSARRVYLFAAAARWLARFHRESAPAVADGEAPGSLVAVLRRGESGPWLVTLAEGHARGTLRRVRSHGDFWPRNLLVETDPARVVGVVDWESAEESELPHHDLFDFVFAHAAAAHDGGAGVRPIDAFRHAVLEPTPLRAALTGFLTTYAHEAGLEPRWLEPLLALYLSELAAGVREVGISAPEQRSEVARTWWDLYSTAGRPVFSG